MGLESKVHDALANIPVVKKVVKRSYQGLSVAMSRPRKSEGKIKRVTPNDEYEYLFGYYDKSPWDASGRYILCIRVKDASREVAPKSIAEIVLIDTENDNSVKVIAKTHTWNVQQGCMAGWLGPDFNKEIFYNDCRHGKYCGVILNIKTGKERILNMPVYTVSDDGKTALSLDFSRLHRLRPGYGYSNLEDKTEGEKVPEGACVWKTDLKTGKAFPVLTYKQLFEFEHRDDMEGAEHKVNHLMLSPDGKRFMVIHRWFKGGKKISRLLTCNIDGSDLYNLSDDNMVSHCCWRNNKEILAYCQKGKKKGYFLMKDKTRDYAQKWEWLTADGHPSYSPNGKLVVTDTYPNRKRLSTIRVLSDTASTMVAKVYSPFKYDNDTRCDLHPRWSRDGKKICFDGCFEGKRGVYIVHVPKNNRKKIKFSIITPMYNIGDSIKPLIKSLNNQYYKNFEVIFIDDNSNENLKIEAKKEIEKTNFNYKYIENKKNIGAGESRNKAIAKADGEYLLFVDADDYVSDELLSKLQTIVEKHDADVILFNLERMKNKKAKKIKTLHGFDTGIIGKDEVLLYSINCVAGKCIKKEIIEKNEIRFPSLIRYEDWVFNCDCFSNSESFYYDNEELYFYINNRNSVVNKNVDADLTCASRAFNLIKKINIKDEIKKFLHMREVEYLYAKKKIFRKPILEKIDFINEKDISNKLIKRRNLKPNKYMVMKLLSNKVTRKVIIRDER